MLGAIDDFLNTEEIMILLLRYVSKGRHWIKFDYLELLRHSIELAEELLNNPEETLKGFDLMIEQIIGSDKHTARFFNLPESVVKPIWEVRNQDVGKFIGIKGLISKISTPEQLCKFIKYECPSCGAIINVIVLENKIPKPHKCGCGRKGGFKTINKKLVDFLKVGIIDDLSDRENLNRTITREKLCLFEKDMACREIDALLKPSKKILVNGYLRVIKKRGEDETEFTTLFIVNSVEFPKTGWDNVEIDQKSEIRILELSQENDIIQRLSQSVVDVEGENTIKLACMLQLAGSPHIYNKNKILDSRGTIHILMIGDTGSAKTTIAKNFGNISPIHSYQSCSTASGKGLVASVIKDADIGNWVVYAGVVPMASGGIVILDEMDKTNKDDFGDHNHSMNDMLVPVAKANVKAVLETKTSYLATANPIHKVFSMYEDFYRQIDMPKDLMDRFDVIFPVVTTTDDKRKDKIMDIILDRHTTTMKEWNPEFSVDFIRKYVAYCRQNNPNPKINKKFYPLIKEHLLKIMRPKDTTEMRVSFRHMESIIRFAYASAILRLDDVKKQDILLAFKIKYDSFRSLGIIDEHGFMSFEADAGVDVKKRTAYEIVEEHLKIMLPDYQATCEEQELVQKCIEKGLNEVEIDEVLEKKKSKLGELYNPRPHLLQRIG